MKIPVVVVAGPTASGKTSLAISIAKKFGGEIVSADSMQIYKNLNIGTAKPDAKEREEARHHMIDILDIDKNFSVVDYVNLANEAIDDIVKRGHLPVIAGGTGLYIDSLVNGNEFSDKGEDLALRESLSVLAEKEGKEKVYEILLSLDEKASQNIHPNNLKRVIRAIEIIKSTGKSLEASIGKREEDKSPFNVLYLVLDHDREVLYHRIEERVDKMVNEGIIQEAKWLYENSENKNATCMQAIGYKEFFPYFNGEVTLDEAIDTLKKDTRHYAKRQLTWFRRRQDAVFLNGNCDIEAKALSLVEEFLKEGG